MLNEPVESIEQRAHALAKLIEQRVDAACAQCSVVKTTARAGGGSLPLEDLPSFAVKAVFVRGSAAECEAFLVKDCAIPVIPRVQKDHLLFDVRTVQDGEGEVIASNLASYFESEADA